MYIKTFLFSGPPGSGKGTQASLLAKKLDAKVFGGGAGFRKMAKGDTVLARRVKTVIDSGELLPEWLAVYVFHDSLFSLKEHEVAIFDGFGRREEEVETIAQTLEWLDRPYRVLNLMVMSDEVARRIEKRKEVEGRADDTRVSERLAEYVMYTEKAIERFREKGVVIDIDGQRPVDEIHTDIMEKLSALPK